VDLGDGFLTRAAALSQNGPRTSYRALIQSTSAQKCTRSGRSHSTDCSSELSHQCRRLSSSAVNQVGGLLAGGESGDVAAGLVTWASWRQARASTPRNCGWYWPVLCAEGDEFRSGVLPQKPAENAPLPSGCAFGSDAMAPLDTR
jgi:hypothetical protein